jgi:hypothetical protein
MALHAALSAWAAVHKLNSFTLSKLTKFMQGIRARRANRAMRQRAILQHNSAACSTAAGLRASFRPHRSKRQIRLLASQALLQRRHPMLQAGNGRTRLDPQRRLAAS